MAIIFRRKIDIENSLSNNDRQYLIGNLNLAQDFDNIFDDNVEMGISDIKKYQAETAHYHEKCNEYQMVLSGKTKYLDLDKHLVYELSEGDIFVIEKNTKYYQKSIKGTRILFFKVPGGNDKIIVDLNEKELLWGREFDEDLDYECIK